MLSNFTVEFPPGVNVILGPNGCGKSTLLKIMAGIYKPSLGSVAVMGEPPERARGKLHIYRKPAGSTRG